MCDLTNPIFTSKTKAREHLESLRWADGRFCPHCGAVEGTSFVRGKKHRPGLYYCNECKKQFTVTVGTIFERSKIPLNKWMLAFHLMAASKKGMSAHQLHRQLGVTYKTAWFMAHRIREAMRPAHFTSPLGGEGIEEYVRGDAYTNTVEGYFSILKRGITGVYHHVSQEHLKRYLAEFDFRYNERASLGVTDAERAAKAIKGAEGKRLTYQQPH